MKNYIFIHGGEGYTELPPLNGSDPIECDNLQSIGTAEGESVEEAFKNLLREQEFLADVDLNGVSAYELASEEIFGIEAVALQTEVFGSPNKNLVILIHDKTNEDVCDIIARVTKGTAYLDHEALSVCHKQGVPFRYSNQSVNIEDTLDLEKLGEWLEGSAVIDATGKPAKLFPNLTALELQALIGSYHKTTKATAFRTTQPIEEDFKP